jgi:hypothetical protein
MLDYSICILFDKIQHPMYVDYVPAERKDSIHD